MLDSAINGMVSALQPFATTGGLLEGVDPDSILDYDSLPVPTSKHPVITVEWIRDVPTTQPRSRGGPGTRLTIEFELRVSLYVVSAKKGQFSEKKLRDLYFREDSANVFKGLKMGLLSVPNFQTAEGRTFVVRYGPTRRVRPTDARRGEIFQKGCFTVGSETQVFVQTWAGHP